MDEDIKNMMFRHHKNKLNGLKMGINSSNNYKTKKLTTNSRKQQLDKLKIISTSKNELIEHVMDNNEYKTKKWKRKGHNARVWFIQKH